MSTIKAADATKHFRPGDTVYHPASQRVGEVVESRRQQGHVIDPFYTADCQLAVKFPNGSIGWIAPNRLTTP